MSLKQKSRNFRFDFSFVLKTGLEPVRPNGHWILSPTCLPIPPLEHFHLREKLVFIFIRFRESVIISN